MDDSSGMAAQLTAHEFLIEILYAQLLTQLSTDKRERMLATVVEMAQRGLYLAAAAASRSDRLELSRQRDAIALIERFVAQTRKYVAEAA